ncbi:MAG: SDR family NAD(P)-dependent oxidoreductase, partial [Chloroflexota bacterium]|nr:SDR family NAD(P)-dependent oxidoreductase [Chloroflexota bacterium]
AGSTALVTGASSGIGRAVAMALSQAGAQVVGVGRNLLALGALAEAEGVTVVQVDLESADELERFVEHSLPDFPPVDILVNCAGSGRFAPLAEHSAEDIDRLLDVNVRAPIALTKAVLPGMRQRGRGRVVNVASIAGRLGVPNETVYSASKGALAVFSRALDAELAGTGVGATVVIPGVVQTPFFERRGALYDRGWPRPLPPERVAQAIVRAIARDQSEVVVPGWLRIPIWLQATLPGLYGRLQRWFG